jgi:hypothetical protein
MAFRDFTVEVVRDRLGVSIRDGQLFPDAAPVQVRPDFAAVFADGLNLGTAINTEKALSEFAIAPVLLELRRMTGGRFKLFSGVTWSVDPDRGLNGVCDFLLSWGPSQHFMTAPFAVIVEAKNEPILNGLGQCMATMYAATLANTAEGTTGLPIYGAVTSGREWKFLRIDSAVVTIDTACYLGADLPRLMGVLDLITRRPAALPA